MMNKDDRHMLRDRLIDYRVGDISTDNIMTFVDELLANHDDERKAVVKTINVRTKNRITFKSNLGVSNVGFFVQVNNGFMLICDDSQDRGYNRWNDEVVKFDNPEFVPIGKIEIGFRITDVHILEG